MDIQYDSKVMLIKANGTVSTPTIEQVDMQDVLRIDDRYTDATFYMKNGDCIFRSKILSSEQIAEQAEIERLYAEECRAQEDWYDD